MTEHHINEVMGLRSTANIQARKTNVKEETQWLLVALLVVLLAVDISFFAQLFRSLFEDDRGGITMLGYVGLSLKSLLSIGLIIPIKFGYARFYEMTFGSIWDTHKLPSTKYYFIFWLVILGAIMLSVFLLWAAGSAVFIQSAVNYITAELNIGFDNAAGGAPEGADASWYIELMAPTFIATSFAAALIWHELTLLRERRAYNAYARETVQECERYLESVHEVGELETALAHVDAREFLIELISTAHAVIHNTCLTPLHRVKAIIEKASEPSTKTLPDDPAVQTSMQALDDRITLANRDVWLKRVAEAEDALAQLSFLLPGTPTQTIELNMPLATKGNVQ